MEQMDKQRAKDIIACRCAQELKDGYVVNLGIGIPTQCARFFPEGIDITLHAELGLVGQGPSPTPEEADPLHLVDASGAPASVIPGGVIVDSATNFGLIRGGHVDACVLGALEADAEGSFGNWLIPGKKMTGMGGAMDLVNGAKTVILAMIHTQGGKPKIVEKCSLPLTGYRVVNMIVTELAVMVVTPQGLELREYNPELGDKDAAVAQIQAATGAKLHISPALCPMILPENR
jgi:acetate CoA/acetoacetate CoA-transferase beta subunit